MAQKEVMIQIFIAELISLLQARTIDEKISDFHSPKVLLCLNLLVLNVLSSMSKYVLKY